MSNSPHPSRLPRRVLLGPGPSEVEDAVRLALAEAPLGHLDPVFLAVLDDVCALLRRTFRTRNPLTLPVPGTGTSGVEAMFANLIEPGDPVVVAVNGYFGQRMADIAARQGARVTVVESPWGRPADASRVLDAQKKEGARVVGVVHAETSTGVRSDLAQLGPELRARGALLAVDAVTSLGGIELDVDGWCIDACSSCSQKCLGAPSGLAPITFGERAVARIEARTRKVASFYLDAGLLQAYVAGDHRYHHTASSPLVVALHRALVLLHQEGLDARIARHAEIHEHARAGLVARGFEYVAAPEHRLPHLNAVRVPPGTDDKALRRSLLERYDIEIGGGLGPLAGSVVRIGLMGAGATRAHAALLFAALDDVLAGS